MSSRNKIINTIGASFLVKNLEADEFSYQKALQSAGKKIDPSFRRSRKLYTSAREYLFSETNFRNLP